MVVWVWLFFIVQRKNENIGLVDTSLHLDQSDESITVIDHSQSLVQLLPMTYMNDALKMPNSDCFRKCILAVKSVC